MSHSNELLNLRRGLWEHFQLCSQKCVGSPDTYLQLASEAGAASWAMGMRLRYTCVVGLRTGLNCWTPSRCQSRDVVWKSEILGVRKKKYTLHESPNTLFLSHFSLGSSESTATHPGVEIAQEASVYWPQYLGSSSTKFISQILGGNDHYTQRT